MSSKYSVHHKLISYQGIITKKNLFYQRFELDKKVVLYTTFCGSISCSFVLGSEVLVSNAHALKIKGAFVLVCCDYSSLRIINNLCTQGEEFLRPNIFDSLSFQSLLWIEEFSSLLETRFGALLGTDVSFENNHELLENVIDFFFGNQDFFQNQSNLERKELGPTHNCSAFNKEAPPLPSDITDISGTVSSIKDSAFWLSVTKDWKFSVTNVKNRLLIGALLPAPDGSLCLMDTSGFVPLLLTDRCDQGLCCSTVLPRLVVLQNYALVGELKGAYLHTSCCRFHTLVPPLVGDDGADRPVLVLSRLWTTPPSYLVAPLLPPKVAEEELCSNKEGSNKLEKLTAQLEALSIGGEGVEEVCFESPHHHLFPGHVYRLGDKRTTPVHDPECEGNHTHTVQGYLQLVVCSIKDLFFKKTLEKKTVIIGILIDKIYMQENNTQCTLRLRLQDTSSKDSILAYISSPPVNLVGLLPCTVLELYRFSLCRSRNGGLYLKASHAFGLEVKSIASEWIRGAKVLSKELSIPSQSPVFHSSFRRIFTVEKIVSAEVLPKCLTCDTKTKSPCSLQDAITIKVMATFSDGISQFLSICYGEAALELLCIDRKQWKSIVSFLKITQKPLIYSENTLPSHVCFSTILDQVFHHYCSSKATTRQVIAECLLMPNPDSSRMLQRFIWCKNIQKIRTSRAMLYLYKELKTQDASLEPDC